MFLKKLAKIPVSSSVSLYFTNARGFAMGGSERHEVTTLFKNNFISLCFNLPNEFHPKHFFINADFSFKSLKHIIQEENPAYDIEFDFSQIASKIVDEDTKIVAFLDNNLPGEVLFKINEEEYLIKNNSSSPLQNILKEQLKNAQKDPTHTFFWFDKCLKNKIQPSHSGTLAHFLRNVNHHLESFQAKKSGVNLTETELTQIFQKSIEHISDSTFRKLERAYQRRNEIDSEINIFEDEKRTIEQRAERTIRFYEYLIFGLSLGHLISFEYMIFHVEWLGWDIIEPITYTVQCLTVLLGIRFFWRYGADRSFETMRKFYRQKIIYKNRQVKERYLFIQKQLDSAYREKDLVRDKINLYLNRKNYSQFLLDDHENLRKK